MLWGQLRISLKSWRPSVQLGYLTQSLKERWQKWKQGGDEPEDIQPDVAAAMMHTEEIGLHLGDAPDQLFSYLFKSRGSLGSGSKVDVMPGVSEGLAVPGRISTMPDDNLLVEPGGDMQQAPSTDVYSENVGTAPVTAEKPSVASKRQDFVTTVASELGPGIDYFLEASPPLYYSRVQIRGSLPPDWFPGYLETLPHLPQNVRLSNSPSEVMKQSWYCVQPENFRANDLKMCLEQFAEEPEKKQEERHEPEPERVEKKKSCCCKK